MMAGGHSGGGEGGRVGGRGGPEARALVYGRHRHRHRYNKSPQAEWLKRTPTSLSSYRLGVGSLHRSQRLRSRCGGAGSSGGPEGSCPLPCPASEAPTCLRAWPLPPSSRPTAPILPFPLPRDCIGPTWAIPAPLPTLGSADEHPESHLLPIAI